VREIKGGTVAFGTFSSAHHYLTGDLVQDFASGHPGVRIRVVGQNSAEVADAVRNGELEAGLIVLPVEDAGLDVRVATRESMLYLSADPERVKAPITIEQLAEAPLILADARWRLVDPTRRVLRERAQQAGVTVEPQIEVEYLTAALDLAARGLGDTIGTASVLKARGYARRLHTAPLDPPMYATYAFITRRNAHLSPATREFMKLAARRVRALG
jgi:DNA-binding transcriptional LysR family regulator